MFNRVLFLVFFGFVLLSAYYESNIYMGFFSLVTYMQIILIRIDTMQDELIRRIDEKKL